MKLIEEQTQNAKSGRNWRLVNENGKRFGGEFQTTEGTGFEIAARRELLRICNRWPCWRKARAKRRGRHCRFDLPSLRPVLRRLPNPLEQSALLERFQPLHPVRHEDHQANDGCTYRQNQHRSGRHIK